MPQNRNKARLWLHKAAAQGNQKAQYMLGKRYAQDAKYSKAFTWLHRAAKNGNTDAQYLVGTMYFLGKGTEKNKVRALASLIRARDGGNNQANSVIETIKNLMSESKVAEAQHLARPYSSPEFSHRKSSLYYRTLTAATNGNLDAQYRLGKMYREGTGVLQNYSKALKWYRRAAEQGHPAAQFELGAMYYIGLGTPQDVVKAEQWYRRSAEQGYARAQNNIGQMYRMGEAVPQNYVQAAKWFIISKAKGNQWAKKALHLLEVNMTASQIAEAQKLAQEWWNNH